MFTITIWRLSLKSWATFSVSLQNLVKPCSEHPQLFHFFFYLPNTNFSLFAFWFLFNIFSFLLFFFIVPSDARLYQGTECSQSPKKDVFYLFHLFVFYSLWLATSSIWQVFFLFFMIIWFTLFAWWGGRSRTQSPSRSFFYYFPRQLLVCDDAIRLHGRTKVVCINLTASLNILDRTRLFYIAFELTSWSHLWCGLRLIFFHTKAAFAIFL